MFVSLTIQIPQSNHPLDTERKRSIYALCLKGKNAVDTKASCAEMLRVIFLAFFQKRKAVYRSHMQLLQKGPNSSLIVDEGRLLTLEKLFSI